MHQLPVKLKRGSEWVQSVGYYEVPVTSREQNKRHDHHTLSLEGEGVVHVAGGDVVG